MERFNETDTQFYLSKNMERTGIAGIFAASLELTREGIVSISQNKSFDKLMIEKTNEIKKKITL